MSVSVPWAATYWLAQDLADFTGMRLSYAESLAYQITQVAIQAGESSLAYAKGYTNAMAGDVRSDLTKSLNAASDYLSDDIHILRQYVIAEMVPALDAIVESSGTVTDEIAANLVNAYDAIADSRKFAAEVIDKSIMSTGDLVSENYGIVAGWIHEQFEGALAVVNSTIDHILMIPDLLIEGAIAALIPAEAEAWFMTIGDILVGDPVRMLLNYAGDVFKGQLDKVLTIDDAELEKWVAKGSKFMEDIALRSAMSEGAK